MWTWCRIQLVVEALGKYLLNILYFPIDAFTGCRQVDFIRAMTDRLGWQVRDIQGDVYFLHTLIMRKNKICLYCYHIVFNNDYILHLTRVQL